MVGPWWWTSAREARQTGQALAVLEGEIDDFIDAEIRWLRRNERPE